MLKNYLWFWSIALLLLCSCNTRRYLEADQFFLKKNTVVVHEQAKIRNKAGLRYQLYDLIPQKPNSRVLFIPRRWFYYATNEPGDTSRFNKWVRRLFAEPPAIFSDSLADGAATSMQKYLMERKGYFNAYVRKEELNNPKTQKVSVTYHAFPRKVFYIDSVFYESKDTAIHAVLQLIKNQSELKSGQAIDRESYIAERDRITHHLKNIGYASFANNYIPDVIQIDTTEKSGYGNLYVEVLPQPGNKPHQTFYVGDVDVYLDYLPSLRQIEAEQLRDTTIQEIRFHTAHPFFKLKPQTIADAVAIKPGELYHQDDFDNTEQRLNKLGVFKFYRVRWEQVPNTNTINVVVELTLDAKIEVGADFDLNYTNRDISSGVYPNLIGLSASPSMRYRNLFRQGETLVTSILAGVEINPAIKGNGVWNTINLKLQTELYTPKFTGYFKLWRGLSSIGGKPVSNFYQLLNNHAQSRFSASYNYLLLVNFYGYHLLNANFGFEVQRSVNRYTINHAGVDYLLPKSTDTWNAILETNPFMARSFGKQLLTGFIFRDFNFVHTSRANKFGESNYKGVHVELSGLEMQGINALYNGLANRKDTFNFGSINFSHFIKAEADFRYYRQFSPNRTFAARFNIGLAQPFGYSSSIPYLKQFSVGGPNSIRAWPARGLGPGGYIDTLTFDLENRQLFYQTGDIKMEFNLEYRFHLISRIKSALFLDGGNVWTLYKDSNRCGSQFSLRSGSKNNCPAEIGQQSSFIDQIAIGAGLGFRVDFSYFIFRVDLGVPLRYPYSLPVKNNDTGKPTHWAFLADLGQRLNVNLGLGYPF